MADFKPVFVLLANKKNVTDAVNENLISLTLTDSSEFASDMLELVLKADGVQKPPKGAELELWLGYPGSLTKMGLFVVDELALDGWPAKMTIRARAAPFEASKNGLSHLQSQKTRSWKRGITLDDMVAKIAKEHKLQASVSRSLTGIVLPHYDQTAESDIAFLVRIGRKYDGIVKVGGGKLVLYRRGDSNLPLFAVTATDAMGWTYSETSRENEGTVVAFWHKYTHGRRQLVEVGSGDPVKQLRQWYPSEEAAKDAALAELNRRKRGAVTFSVTLPGDAKLSTDCRLAPQGFHPDIPELFVVTSVTHRLSKAGYTCDVAAEQPID
jgi:phage protein D